VKGFGFALLALSLVGCGDAIVDGACADGYEVRDRACRAVVAAPPPSTVESDAGAPDEAGACQADVMVDPNNCGVCGNVCPTGLCNGGVCHGAKPGHIVVVGHDYVGAAPGLAISRVIANAMFLVHRNPVRVVAFEPWANPMSVASVRSTLDHAAALSGRTYSKTIANNAAELRAHLQIENFDVALVFDQAYAPEGALEALGAETKTSLDSFSRVGGVVVVLDGGSGRSEMPKFLTASGMLGVASHERNTAKRVNVVAPADAIGIGVHSPYSAALSSVTFTLSEAASPLLVTVVAEPTSELPVVLHKVVFQ